MLINSKKRLAVLLTSLTGLALGIGASVYLHTLERLRHEVESTFRSRSELISTFVALHRDQVAVMRNLLLEHYAEPGHDAAPQTLQYAADSAVKPLCANRTAAKEPECSKMIATSALSIGAICHFDQYLI